jgi:hypothetical protein
MIKRGGITTGATEDAGKMLTNDAVNPTSVMTAVAPWLRLIAIAIITNTAVSARRTNGKEAIKGAVDMRLFPGSYGLIISRVIFAGL